MVAEGFLGLLEEAGRAKARGAHGRWWLVREFNIVLDDVAITPTGRNSCMPSRRSRSRSRRPSSSGSLSRAGQERRVAIVRAKAGSEAARLISDAITTAGNGLVELRRIEGAKEIAGVLARLPNVSYRVVKGLRI